MISVACAIIEDKNGDVLVTQRSARMSLPLKWEFPGGKVEPEELHEGTIVREIREELGVNILITGKLMPVTFQYPTFLIRLIPFICHIFKGDIQLVEHYAYRWVNLNDLLSLDWAEADIPVVHQYLNHRSN